MIDFEKRLEDIESEDDPQREFDLTIDLITDIEEFFRQMIFMYYDTMPTYLVLVLPVIIFGFILLYIMRFTSWCSLQLNNIIGR